MRKILFVIFIFCAMDSAQGQPNNMPAATFSATQAWWIPTRDTVIALLDTVSPKFNIHVSLRRSLSDSIFVSINGRRDTIVWPRNSCIPSNSTILSIQGGKESFSNFVILKDSLLVISLLSSFTHDLSATWFLFSLRSNGKLYIDGGVAGVAFVCVRPDGDWITTTSGLKQDDALSSFYRRITMYSPSSRSMVEYKMFGDSIYTDDRPDIIRFYKSIK